jgi:hypothetical protein
MTPLKPSLAGMLSFVSSVAIEVVDHWYEIAMWNFMRSPVKPHLSRLWLKLPSSLVIVWPAPSSPRCSIKEYNFQLKVTAKLSTIMSN